MSVTYIRTVSDGTLSVLPLPFSMVGYDPRNSAGSTQLEITYPNGKPPGQESQYEFSRNSVIFSPPLPRGVTVQVSRNTSTDLRYRFTRGARFNAANLEFDLLQVLRIAEEARNLASSGTVGNLHLNGYKITGMSPGTDPADAVNYGQLYKLESDVRTLINGIQITLTSNQTLINGFNAWQQRQDAAIAVLQARVQALGSGGTAPGPGGGSGADLLDNTGRLLKKHWPTSVLGYYSAQSYPNLLSDRWTFLEEGAGGSSGTDLNLTSLARVGQSRASFQVFGKGGYRFLENADDRGRDPREVLTREDATALVRSSVGPLQDRQDGLARRVGALEAGGGGGGGGLTLGDTLDLRGTTVFVASPTAGSSPVTLGYMQNAMQLQTVLIQEQTEAKVHALRLEMNSKVGTGASAPPTPTPNPPTTPPSTSSATFSFGVLMVGSSPSVFGPTGLSADVGQGPQGTSIRITFPAQGLWEIRSTYQGTKRATESFSGSGTQVASSAGTVTSYMVSGYTGVTISVPSNTSPSDRYSLVANFIGNPIR